MNNLHWRYPEGFNRNWNDVGNWATNYYPPLSFTLAYLSFDKTQTLKVSIPSHVGFKYIRPPDSRVLFYICSNDIYRFSDLSEMLYELLKEYFEVKGSFEKFETVEQPYCLKGIEELLSEIDRDGDIL